MHTVGNSSHHYNRKYFKIVLGNGGVTWSVMLAIQAGGSEFDLQDPCKKLGMVEYNCNLSAGEAGAGASLGSCWPVSLAELGSSRFRVPVSKDKMENN